MTTTTDNLAIVSSNENVNCSDSNKESDCHDTSRDEEIEVNADNLLAKIVPEQDISYKIVNSYCKNVDNINNNNDDDDNLEPVNSTDVQIIACKNPVLSDFNPCNILNGNHNNDHLSDISLDKKNVDGETVCDENLKKFIDDSRYETCTDFVGLEIALNESNVKEPFLEELCTKMGSVVKPPVSVDVKLQSLSKDDSTDIDVSYSDSLSPESDQDIGSSFVDSSYQHLQQDIENKFKTEIER